VASPEGFLNIVQGLSDFARGAKSSADDTLDLIQRALGGKGITPQQAREVKEAIEQIRPSRAPEPLQGSQLRLDLRQPGGGARAYSPQNLRVKTLRMLFVLSSVLFLLNLLLLGCAALPPKRSKQVLGDGLTLRS
jgi:hypothetical protein